MTHLILANKKQIEKLKKDKRWVEVKQRAIKHKREALACIRHEQHYCISGERYRRYRRGFKRCPRCGLKLNIWDYQRMYNERLSKLISIINMRAKKNANLQNK